MKKINKLFATIISGTILFSSLGTTAFAEESTTDETPFYTYEEIQNMSEEEFLAIGDNQAVYDSIMYFINYEGFLVITHYNPTPDPIPHRLDGIKVPKSCFLEDKMDILTDDWGYYGNAENVLKPEYAERAKKFMPSGLNIDTHNPGTFPLVNSKGTILANRKYFSPIENFRTYYPEGTMTVYNYLDFFSNGEDLERNKKEALEVSKILFGYAQVFGDAILTEISNDYASLSPDQMLCGDVNMDEKIGLKDALALNRLIVQAANGNELNEYQKVSADCYGDGKIDTADSVILLQYLVGMHKTLPVKPE